MTARNHPSTRSAAIARAAHQERPKPASTEGAAKVVVPKICMADEITIPQVTFNSTEFYEEIVEPTIRTLLDNLVTKGAEYANDVDRMHNFNKGARRNNKHPAEICLEYRDKHEVSISDMVADLAAGKPINKGKIDEKIDDSITYLLILKGLLKRG